MTKNEFKHITKRRLFIENDNLVYLGYEDNKGKRPAIVDLNAQPCILLPGTSCSLVIPILKNIIWSLSLKKNADIKYLIVSVVPHDNELILFQKLPGVVGTISRAWEHEKSLKQIESVLKEIKRRRYLFNKAKVKNFNEYKQMFPRKKLARYIVIIAELADIMWNSNKKIQTLISKIVKNSSWSGVSLLCASLNAGQYVITRKIAKLPFAKIISRSSPKDIARITGFQSEINDNKATLFFPLGTKTPVKIKV